MYICMCLLLQLFKMCVVVIHIIEPHLLTVDSLIEILCFARANLYICSKIFVESLQNIPDRMNRIVNIHLLAVWVELAR